ncbi:MAG: hypothetical protein GF347_00640 [Candidatus Moranbacteria bacterium]|nr:hypothetical protein [Candidatus Moranbacteria bacterium]
MIRFKYKFSKDLNEFLGKILVNCFREFKKKLPFGATLVVPVPIHKKKLKKRGFNQSRLLAEILIKNFGELNLCDCLNRKEYHADQAKLDKNRRIRNLAGAMDIKNNRDLNGEVIILIDDVATTGSTLNECSKVLKKMGAKYICGIVLARARLYSL